MDVSNRRAVEEVVSRFQPDFILHCAALARPQDSNSSSDLFDVNVRGTEHLAHAATHVSAQIIFLSTDLVYQADAGFVNEETPVSPSGAGGYSASKLEAEKVVREASGSWTIVRPTLMFGHGTPRSNSFTQFLERKWAAGEQAPVFSDQIRSFLYVGDLLRGIERMLGNPDAVNRLFVCGGAEDLTRAEFGLRYADAYGVERELCRIMRSVDLEGYVGGASDIRIDSSRLRALCWAPRPLTECFAEMQRERGKFRSQLTE